MQQTKGFTIKAEERQSWGSITMVWIGAMICVPALMIGGMIGAGLSLGAAALAITVGYLLICLFMSFMGMHAVTPACLPPLWQAVHWENWVPNTSSAPSWQSPALAGLAFRRLFADHPFLLWLRI